MKKLQVQETISPNLIPMIDIMFLLLLFFMLSADMSQRDLEAVVLPKAISVKEDKENKDQKERLTINVYHLYDVKCENYAAKKVCREEKHWRVRIKGKDYTPAQASKETYTCARCKKEQVLASKNLHGRLEDEAAKDRDPKNPLISERKVMLRVDGSAPFGLAQRAMNECANAGIYKIEVGAARPPEDKKKPKT